ncbi:MAG: ABC transporter ATP-binding protein [SAR324 cluster bacterium]|nr:ABC transporter ATP-binding protein [SAR324 cluster bacterium]
MTFFRVDNLAIQFGGVKAVDDVSFEVREGQVFSIIGPNGAGKTTVFNLISRMYTAKKGRVTFRDADISRVAPHRITALGIARTFQNIELFQNATVLQNLLLGRHVHRRSNLFSELLHLPSVQRMEIEHREKVEQIIEFLDLQHYREVVIMNLPYGVCKVVELARALCTEPKLLMLDEPASGLNPEETEDMAFWIEDIQKDLGITILMVEHNMNLVAEVSDRVLAMNDGRTIAQGSPQEVQRNDDVIRAYLGG